MDREEYLARYAALERLLDVANALREDGLEPDVERATRDVLRRRAEALARELAQLAADAETELGDAHSYEARYVLAACGRYAYVLSKGAHDEDEHVRYLDGLDYYVDRLRKALDAARAAQSEAAEAREEAGEGGH